MTKINLAKQVIKKIKGGNSLPCNLSIDFGNGEVHDDGGLITLSRSELLYLISLQVENKELFSNLKLKSVNFPEIYATLAIEEYCSFYEILEELPIRMPNFQVPEHYSKEELLKIDIAHFSGSSEHLDNYVNGFVYILKGILSGNITDKDVDGYLYYYEYDGNDFLTPLENDLVVKHKVSKIISEKNGEDKLQ